MCFCSPAGRCGLIRLSCFLLLSSAYSLIISVSRSSFPAFSHFQHPTQEWLTFFTTRSNHNFISQSICNPIPGNLIWTSIYQIRQHSLQLIIASFHAKPIVSFRSFATLAFPVPNAKNHASLAVNGSCLSPSYFGLSIHHPCSTRRRLALQ